MYKINNENLLYLLCGPGNSTECTVVTGTGRKSKREGRANIHIHVQFSSVQLLSHVRLFATPWITARQASLSITNSRSLPKPMSIESVMPSRHLILCRPLLLLPPIPPSIRVFSNESTLHVRWPKYWSFSFSINPSNEHPGLISFRMDWLDLPAVQGTLKSFLQHHSSKASIFQHSAFLTVQLSHPYMTTGKTIALTRQTFVGKVMSLLFNMLSRLVITFLPKLLSKCMAKQSVVLQQVLWFQDILSGKCLQNHLIPSKMNLSSAGQASHRRQDTLGFCYKSFWRNSGCLFSP